MLVGSGDRDHGGGRMGRQEVKGLEVGRLEVEGLEVGGLEQHEDVQHEDVQHEERPRPARGSLCLLGTSSCWTRTQIIPSARSEEDRRRSFFLKTFC